MTLDEKYSNMKTIETLALTKLALLATLMISLPASAGQPLRSDGFVIEDRILDSAGNPPANDNTLIYSKGGDTEVCTTPYLDLPVLAPDGHQVTAGEWRAAEGRASVKCSAAGTHVTIHLSGLIPEGVYTIWLVTFKAPG